MREMVEEALLWNIIEDYVTEPILQLRDDAPPLNDALSRPYCSTITCISCSFLVC